MPSNKNIDKAFEKIELKGIAIDAYISGKESVKRHLADKEFTYGYKKVRADGSQTRKFATLMILKGIPALILHIGELAEKKGLEIQREVDEKLHNSYERNEMEIKEKAHEVFIRLDWVDDLSDIKKFIDESYSNRN